MSTTTHMGTSSRVRNQARRSTGGTRTSRLQSRPFVPTPTLAEQGDRLSTFHTTTKTSCSSGRGLGGCHSAEDPLHPQHLHRMTVASHPSDLGLRLPGSLDAIRSLLVLVRGTGRLCLPGKERGSPLGPTRARIGEDQAGILRRLGLPLF